MLWGSKRLCRASWRRGSGALVFYCEGLKLHAVLKCAVGAFHKEVVRKEAARR